MSIRVVYDSPMLVPRDEAVPALVINPHNPPPWLQNSTAAQPQIIYVQQQQNYIQQQQPQQQAYVQQIDQNQIYLQQYAYQNPQMFLQNYDQLRQIQIIPNVAQIPANHDPNDLNRMLTQAYVQTQQNIVQNHAPVQNQVSMPATPAPRQIVPEKSDAQKIKEIRMSNMIQMNQQTQDTQMIQQPIHNSNQFLPRPNQQIRPRMARPQVSNNISNQQRPIVRNVRTPRFAYRPIQPRLRYQVPSVTVQKRFVQSSNMPNVINVSNIVGTTPTNSNIVGRLPINANVVGPLPTNMNVIGPTSTNMNVVGPTSTNMNIIGPIANANVGTLQTNTNVVGPLPINTSVVSNIPTNTSVVGAVPTNTSIIGTIPTNINVIGSTPSNTSVVGTMPINSSHFRNISTNTNTVGPTNTNVVGPIMTSTNIIGPPNNNYVESKLTNKITGSTNTNIVTPTSLNSTVTESSSIAPVENKVSRKRKSESPDEIQNKLNVLAINNSPILSQLVTPIEEISKNDSNKTISDINTVSTQVHKEDLEVHTPSTHGLVNQINLAQNQLKEKLVRNTVFTQARGRILNVKNEVNVEATPMEVQTEKVEPTKDNINSKQIEDIDISETKLKDNDKNIKVIEKEDENIRTVNKGINRSDATDEMKLTEKDFVLTHVLDGFVIQESNVAFPIRKPTIERTIRLSSEALELNALDTVKDLENEIPSVAILVKDKINRTQDIESKSTDTTGTIHKPKAKTSSKHKSKEKSCTENTVKDNTETKSKDISSPGLKTKDKSCDRLDSLNESCAAVDKNDSDNPFRNLKPSVVKGWTMEQLTSHLSEHGWKETSGAFFEHEIDGESLLLVSKSQLVAIGVKEEHAIVIMDFMST